MTGIFWIDLIVGLLGALLLLWPTLILALVVLQPRRGLLPVAVKLLPELLGLLRRMAADKAQPNGVRIRLAVMFGYLRSPIDLVPDFIPTVGNKDDAIVASAGLRAVVRQVGLPEVRRYWQGSDEGWAAVCRLADPDVGGAWEADYDERPTRPTRRA
ncbi:YkvA family protein [Amycolatopsis suaedae]|uniref:DUF1232 domain-containing protein n=1 Tax=Amycolatopsis suaedae TaxID=2510978 RepID=A0A4Q7J5N6_9PSEU|nr:DUF1232 domain-containing protein [Amycolatopsis suaedae]RZQ62086.1 DUF1232 domain-containing protein [Amycolatopsis suaedae]